jgi:hypothetical protein
MRPTAVLAIAALALGACTSPSPTDPRPAPPATAPAASPPITLPADYRTTALSAIASRLHTSTEALRTDLAAPSAILMTLAKPLGLAEDQLAATLRSALTDTGQTEVRSGTWTQSQAAQVNAYWSAEPDPVMITQITQWYRTNG